jgi:hypothetical protein
MPNTQNRFAHEMKALADEFEARAKTNRANGDREEATKFLRAAYALRKLADCDQ